MGNRAVITIAKRDTNGEVLKRVDDNEIGVYVHWNGGYDSVNAFLKYCKAKGYVSPEKDCYGWARLCQVIGNFFGGTNSLGIDRCGRLDCDNWDNGVYLIEDWEIVGRVYYAGSEQNYYKLRDMIKDINGSQSEKLTDDELEQFFKKEGIE